MRPTGPTRPTRERRPAASRRSPQLAAPVLAWSLPDERQATTSRTVCKYQTTQAVTTRRTACKNQTTQAEPGSASWVITRADGRPVETEPWSCVPGTPPISHLELAVPDDALDSSKLPLGVAAFLECETRADEYFREYKKVLGHAYGIDESDDADEEPPMTRLRHETRPNGRQVQIDDRGWALKKNGQRDLRYT